MLPLLSLFDLVNAAISAVIAVRVFMVYRQAKHEAAWYFLMFYVSFTFFWFFWGMPGVLVSNPQTMALTSTAGFMALYLSMVAMVQVPFFFLNRREGGGIAAILLATSGAVFFLARIFNLEPSVLEVIGGVVYWRTGIAPWLRYFTGAVSLGVALLCTGTFGYLGWKERMHPVVYARSMYLASGMAALVIAAPFSFFLFNVVGFFWANMIASMLVILGLLLMLFGILVEAKQNVAVTIKQEGIEYD